MRIKLIAALGAVVALGAIAFVLVGQRADDPPLTPTPDPALAPTGDSSEAARPAKPAGPGPFSAPAAIKGAIEIEVPSALGGMAALGGAAFAKNCASCHGENAAGSENGPPLVHVIYEPGHHGDGAFLLAAQQGVRAHHWRFGDMPPVEGVTETQIGAIVEYVRALQRANGIK